MEPMQQKPNKFILDGHTPVPEHDLFKWGTWFENAENCKVAQTEVNGAKVSTVFLALNHNFGEGTPILFETMIFGNDEFEDFQWRYSTWEQAEAGHEKAVSMLKAHPTDTGAGS